MLVWLLVFTTPHPTIWEAGNPAIVILMSRYESIVRSLLGFADIQINGPQPWDIHVKDKRFYKRALATGALGFGESYTDGWWDCDQLHILTHKILRAGLEQKVKPLKVRALVTAAKLTNLQRRSRAYQIGEYHYDLGNEMFKLMLDERMVYSCAYWKDAQDLETAQKAKLDLVCRKLGLEPGMRVLDIGCGWGSFAKFAAEKYRTEVVGITVSREQIELGKKLCQGTSVELRFQDYRDLHGIFDRVVSIGMFEHVGVKNYRTFMEVVDRCLDSDGLFLLHTIGANTPGTEVGLWVTKYIFPNSVLPTIAQLAHATEGMFQMEDWHNLNVDYSKTLMAWMRRFDKNWEEIKKLGYDIRFYRMWRFFLMTSAGSFSARHIHPWQVVFSKKGIEGGVEAVR